MLREEKLNTALKKVSAFIHSLGNLEPLSKERDFDLLFSNADEGTISLGAESAEKYRECLSALWEAVSSDEQISLRTVERIFQAAIFEALDIRHKREGDLSVRLQQALQNIESGLTAPLQRFLVFCPINGLALDGLPMRVGNVEFAVFGNEQLDQFRAAVATHKVDQEQLKIRYDDVEKLGRKKDLFGRVAAAVEVDAIDGGAAESLAIRHLRLAVDVVNFYSDLLPYNHAHISLPADADTARVVIPKLVVKGTQQTNVSINHAWWGRVGELSLTKLWELDTRRKLGFARLTKLLADERNDLEEKIIASIQWAGRATAEIRKEEAFVLYAIALESMVLADQNPSELTYRLKVRTAHLLANKTESRRDVFSKIGHLYGIRSKIVHSGRYQVTDADLALLRNITKAALIRICTGEEFMSMRTGKELGEWFQDRVLG
jgi:hypothetical protein